MFHTLLWCLWGGLLSHLALWSHRVHSRVTGFQIWFSRIKPQTSCSGIPLETCWPSKQKVQGRHTEPEPVMVSHFSHPSETIPARSNVREGLVLVPGVRECSLPWQGWQELVFLWLLAFLAVAFHIAARPRCRKLRLPPAADVTSRPATSYPPLLASLHICNWKSTTNRVPPIPTQEPVVGISFMLWFPLCNRSFL